MPTSLQILNGDIDENDVDAVLHFLLRSKDEHADSLLLAAELGRDAIVYLFYTRNKRLFETTIGQGKTVLYAAAKGNHLSTVKLVLGFERHNDLPLSGLSPMIPAARNGNTAIIQALHDRHPQLIFKTWEYHVVPLNEAVRCGHVKATELLVRLGSLDHLSSITNPFVSAVDGNQLHMVPLLLRLGVPSHKLDDALRHACAHSTNSKMIEHLNDQGSLAITDEGNPIDILRCAQVNSANVIITLVRLGYRCFMINSHSLTIIGNYSALAAILTLLPDYRPYLEKQHSRAEAWRDVLLLLEDENFLRDTRYAAFFAEPLLLRCLREDHRRLIDHRALPFAKRIRPRPTPL